MMYKGFNTPWIGRDDLKLGITPTSLSVINQCIISPTYNKKCTSIKCADCVCGLNNMSIGLEYLIEQKLITKVEALAFSLDNIGG